MVPIIITTTSPTVITMLINNNRIYMKKQLSFILFPKDPIGTPGAIRESILEKMDNNKFEK